MKGKVVRTTPTLPTDLFLSMDLAVKEGKARSRGELIARAIRRELAAHERAEIDAAFATMATDPLYQNEATSIATEFAGVDTESLRLGEGQR